MVALLEEQRISEGYPIIVDNTFRRGYVMRSGRLSASRQSGLRSGGEDDIGDKDTSDGGIPELGNNVDRSINYVKPGTGCQSASNPGVLQR